MKTIPILLASTVLLAQTAPVRLIDLTMEVKQYKARITSGSGSGCMLYDTPPSVDPTSCDPNPKLPFAITLKGITRRDQKHQIVDFTLTNSGKATFDLPIGKDLDELLPPDQPIQSLAFLSRVGTATGTVSATTYGKKGTKDSLYPLKPGESINFRIAVEVDPDKLGYAVSIVAFGSEIKATSEGLDEGQSTQFLKSENQLQLAK